jgi:hypothetical protein
LQCSEFGFVKGEVHQLVSILETNQTPNSATSWRSKGTQIPCRAVQ